jgi:hypothetical protein
MKSRIAPHSRMFVTVRVYVSMDWKRSRRVDVDQSEVLSTRPGQTNQNCVCGADIGLMNIELATMRIAIQK